MRSQEIQYTVGRNLIHEAVEGIAKGVGSLDSLNINQLITAWMYFDELPKRVNDNQLGQPIDVGEWFFELTPAQQDQVIAYGRSQNVGKQINMVPNWYEDLGLNGAFRFEIPIPLPVVSR
ncbi:MAG TPA: hypothetical protein VIM31_02260 [Candidatus Microsaccharimonas sp.]|jgi:hypothetical protein